MAFRWNTRVIHRLHVKYWQVLVVNVSHHWLVALTWMKTDSIRRSSMFVERHICKKQEFCHKTLNISADQWGHSSQSIDQSINRSINQSSMDQSINRSINQSSMDQSINTITLFDSGWHGQVPHRNSPGSSGCCQNILYGMQNTKRNECTVEKGERYSARMKTTRRKGVHQPSVAFHATSVRAQFRLSLDRFEKRKFSFSTNLMSSMENIRSTREKQNFPTPLCNLR